MNALFDTSDPSEQPEKISIDDLYDGKQKRDMRILNTFKLILGRIHNKIKVTSRQQIDQQYCWFVVPEFMLGIPSYNHNDCVVYLVKQLQDNGFRVKYTHPNLLLISWQHWVPSYVRQELKRKAGIEIDGQGNLTKKDGQTQDLTNNPFARTETSDEKIKGNSEKQFRDIKTYNPLGGSVYKESLLQDIQNKFNK
jgi:hypothetical protein